MSITKAADLAFVRFSAPDLDVMETFLADFGMTRAARSDEALAMKGIGGAPALHVTQKGEPGFAGLAFLLPDEASLGALADHAGVPVQTLGVPGNPKGVRLTDPNGFSVEALVWAKTNAEAPPAHAPINSARGRPRRNEVSRVAGGPARVVRLGHCVINVRDFRESEAWYKEHFGLITSDEIDLAPGQALGAFLRCDRGTMPVDHHTLFLVGTGEPKFNHAAFEVVDFDDLMTGHSHLKAKGYAHEWGVGRHILGSQVFDYWRDPWGHAVEHWTDGDLFDAASGSRHATLAELMGTQWGPDAPPTMA
ncbi:MAG: glyoxalase [Alphaproteobacteria bacterium]|nr:glyoxalase [Alphaproteobacteria bacterium]